MLITQALDQAIQREIAGLSGPTSGEKLQTESTPGEAVAALASRKDELQAIGPQVGGERDARTLGTDLIGGPQQQVMISLDQSIHSAVTSNLGVLAARFGPAITEQDVIAAEAVFDALWYGSADFEKIDEPDVVRVLNSVPLGTPISASERYRFETGIRKLFTTGGTLAVSTDLTRSQTNTPGLSLSPDPAYFSAARLTLSQPLLRGFGPAVNTATIRLARNTQKRAVQTLESSLLKVIDDTETAYWTLVLAWDNLAIQEWLLKVGIEVRDVLQARFAANFDVKQAERSDAIARVEQRRALVVNARRRVRLASDALKALMNDENVPVGSEVVLAPADHAAAAPVSYNLIEAIRTAVANRPEIQQSILSIDDSSIRLQVADNARLPLLNLTAGMALTGVNGSAGGSYENLSDGDFIDYAAGLAFEWPIGNRQAEANYRAARLGRSAALVDYRNAVQGVVVDVKTALRDVITDYELIEATRSARIAAAENLRTLLVQEQTMAGLTPEFLNLKFERQNSLALTQFEEVAALTSYSTSVAGLYKAMGTGLSMKGIELKEYTEPPPSSVP